MLHTSRLIIFVRTGRVLLSTIGAPCGAVRADKPIHKVRASVAEAEIEPRPEIGVFSLRIPRHCTQPLTRLLLGQFDSFHGVAGYPAQVDGGPNLLLC